MGNSITPLIVTVIVAIAGSGGFWSFLQWRGEKKSKTHSLKDNILTKLDCIESEITDVNSNLYHTKNLSLAMSRDKLNFLCNKYIKLGYIPSDEYVAFKEIGDAYIDAGGNSEIKTKFNLVITYEVK